MEFKQNMEATQELQKVVQIFFLQQMGCSMNITYIGAWSLKLKPNLNTMHLFGWICLWMNESN